MTQDEPERVKVEAISRAIDPVAWDFIDKHKSDDPPHVAVPLTRARIMGMAQAAFDVMSSQISVSEKRAETAEAERDEAKEMISVDRRAYQAWNDETAAQRDFAIIAQLKAESERDSSQASLLRVEAALKEAKKRIEDDIAAFGPCEHDVNICVCDLTATLAQINTALSPHTEK